MKKNFIPALGFAGIMACYGNAQAITIDDFGGNSFSGDQPLTGVDIGAASGGFARSLDATGSGPVSIAVNDGNAIGQYSHSQDAGVTGMSMITYNLGGIDLTTDSNAFRLELVNVDLNGEIGVQVNPGAGPTVSISTTQIIVGNGGAPSFADFLFADFAGVNFASVDSVKFFVDGSNQAAFDATIDNFGTVCSSLTASGPSGVLGDNGQQPNIDPALCQEITPPVPEPASLTLLGLALGGLGITRRRKRRAV